jgi:hypothetical protein
MKRFLRLLAPRMAKTTAVLTALFFINFPIFAQVVGDYGSANATGTWTNATDWVVCATNGTWSGATVAATAPTNSSTIFIRTAHTMALPMSDATTTYGSNLTIDGTLSLTNAAFTAARSGAISTALTLNGTMSFATTTAFGITFSSPIVTTNGTSKMDHNGSTTPIASTLGASTSTITVNGLAIVSGLGTTAATLTLNANSLFINGLLTVGNPSVITSNTTIQATAMTVGASGSINTATGSTAIMSVRPIASFTNNGNWSNGNLGLDYATSSGNTCTISGNKITVRSIKPISQMGTTLDLDADAELNPLAVAALQVMGNNGRTTGTGTTVINVKAGRTLTINNATASGGSLIGIAGNNGLGAASFAFNVYGTVNMNNVATSNSGFFIGTSAGNTSKLQVYSGGLLNMSGGSGIDASKGNLNAGTVSIIIDAGGRLNQVGGGLFNTATSAAGGTVSLTINGIFDFGSTFGAGTNKNLCPFTVGPNATFRIKDGAIPSLTAPTVYTLDPTATIEYYGATAFAVASGQTINYTNLTISNTGGVSFNNGFSMTGNLKLIGTGVSINGSQTYKMNGTTPQTIDGNGNSISRLTIENAAGVSLLSALTIGISTSTVGVISYLNNNLTLTTGNLNIGSNTFTILYQTSSPVGTGGKMAVGATGTVIYANPGGIPQSVANFMDDKAANIIVNNPLGVNVLVPTTLTGNLTLTSGNALGATLIMGGTSSQTINGNNNSISNLRINNSSGVTLGSATKVLTGLLLSSGNLTTTATNLLTLGNPTDGISGTVTRDGGMVVGPLSHFVSASAIAIPYLFPVGNGTIYTPATVTYTADPSAAGNLTGEYIASNPGTSGLPLTGANGAITTVGTAGFWRINQSNGLADGTYNMELTPSGISVGDYSKLEILKRPNSGAWILDGTHVPAVNPVLYRTGMTGFSEFCAGIPQVTIPVELVFFNAKAKNGDNILTWATASELNNSHFDVERSADGAIFTRIYTVKGNGTTATPNTYTMTDEGPLSITHYYRLRQVDFNGKETVSKVVAVQRKPLEQVKIYPTLSSGILTIELPINDNYTLTINDLTGRQVLQQHVDNHTPTVQLDIHALTSGSYFMTVQTTKSRITERFVKL